MSFIKPKFALLFFCFFLQILFCKAQEKFVFKETFLEAESYFEHEEFEDALPLYVQLKENAPNNYNLDYKIGRCYLSSPFKKQKSIEYLEIAVKHISVSCNSGKYNELNTPVDAFFYLGDAYRINNYLGKAISTYKLFLTKCSPSVFDTSLVSKQINSCYLALKSQNEDKDVSKTNLSELINTRYSDINPVVSVNDDIIVYTTKLPFYDALFFSQKINGKWTAPVNLMPELQVDNDCYPVCVSADGKEMILYRSDNYLGDLYVSRFANGKWSKIQKLNTNINTKYWESHATLSADRKTMYFTSNREGGYGGLDIYKSVRIDINSNNWGPAVNLGPIINSPYNEETPFILSNNKRLYFSSFGHETLGGYDVFYSERNDDGSWAKPVNLGSSVNTTDDDLFFCPVLDGNTGYMALYDSKGQGKYDIYKLKILTPESPREYLVNGSIIVINGKHLGDDVFITVMNKNTKDTIFKKKVTTLNFSFKAPAGEYEIRISSGNFEPFKKDFSITKGEKNTNLDFNAVLNEKLPPLVAEITKASATDNILIYNSDNSETPANSQTDQSSALTNETVNNKQDSFKADTTVTIGATNTKSVKSESLNDSNGTSSVKTGFWNGLFHSWKGILSFSSIPLILILIFLWKRRKKEDDEN
jgi:hypothetical protein